MLEQLKPFKSVEDTLADETFVKWLGGIVGTEREGWFLELLAQLEYVGCRKILKGVPFGEVTVEVLQHVSEEAQHAFLLKNQAVRVHGNKTWTDSMFGAAGWRYFSDLDREISLRCQGSEYQWVSWAIEQRVLWVYPQYLELTQNAAVQATIRVILAQEARHGEYFGGRGEQTETIAREIECGLWRRLVGELEGQ